MDLDPELLKILVCPACKTALEYHGGDSAELVCAGCRRHYEVQDGIPNLIIEEARVIEEK